MTRFAAAVGLCAGLSACALKGDVRRVEQQVQALRTEIARADSARADFLELMFRQEHALQQRIHDSLALFQRRLSSLGGDIRADMTEAQRQLLQIQELLGQSQQRLTQLQAQLDRRASQATQQPVEGGGEPGPPRAGDVSPEEIYDVSVQQLRRGSPQTARLGFQMLLDEYPSHPRASDALFLIGESWERTDADSAAVAYGAVAERFATSPRAPTALYRLGLLAEQRGDLDGARVYYQRVVRGYPGSDAAQLASSKLNRP